MPTERARQTSEPVGRPWARVWLDGARMDGSGEDSRGREVRCGDETRSREERGQAALAESSKKKKSNEAPRLFFFFQRFPSLDFSSFIQLCQSQ